jgi:hypothetical protein
MCERYPARMAMAWKTWIIKGRPASSTLPIAVQQARICRRDGKITDTSIQTPVEMMMDILYDVRALQSWDRSIVNYCFDLSHSICVYIYIQVWGERDRDDDDEMRWMQVGMPCPALPCPWEQSKARERKAGSIGSEAMTTTPCLASWSQQIIISLDSSPVTISGALAPFLTIPYFVLIVIYIHTLQGS